MSRLLRRCGLAALLAASVGLAHAQSSVAPPPLKRSPKCDVPFPEAALAQAPAGFQGETLVGISFTVRGEFRSAQLLRSSGNETLDQEALRAAVGARCEPLGNVNDPALKDALIGIPFAFTFDQRQGASAEALPIR
ncbi:energy transducer TonB [Verticiella sediminum]|nr:TonB family protein [Verticiella sediminum]